jgi:hypothetical protein
MRNAAINWLGFAVDLFGALSLTPYFPTTPRDTRCAG